MIVPSIDLIGGKAVQLRRGREHVLSVDDVTGLAERFGAVGEIAVIDLDAAMGNGDNEALVKRLCRIARCRVGGGVRSVEKARRLLAAGARSVIVGTAATPALLAELPRERTIVAVDARAGEVVDHGWTAGTGEGPVARAERLAPYCAGFLYTLVETEGMLQGIDVAAVRALVQAVPHHAVTAAGGVTTLDDVVALDRAGADAQVGMALYTGRFTAAQAFAAALDWDKTGGLIPTIVQAPSGRVLMLAYSNRESLDRALTDRVGAYHSRSRGGLWIKGETSGHTQRLLWAEADCDRDTLIFHVEQTGAACHRGTDNCFADGARGYDFHRLFEIVGERLAEPTGEKPSYTRRLAADPAYLRTKLLEEAREFADDEGDDNLVWEAGDLLYHMAVKLAARGIGPEALLNELWRRVK